MAKITMKAKNIMLSGSGGAGTSPMDRGSDFQSDRSTTNPFHRANYIDRWREYVNWYYTSWMARKGVDIPVEDAMRGGFTIKRVDPMISRTLMRRWEHLQGTDKLEMASKQERLLGGCAIMIVASDKKVGDDKALMADPLNMGLIAGHPGAIHSLNMVDINRISIPNPITDVFDPAFDNPPTYWVDGVEVDKSRLIVFDGKPLFGRTTYSILFPTPRVNPAGFGESILTTVYEDLIRAVGTSQGAFHLVNMASVMLIMMQDFSGLQTSKAGQGKITKMQDIANSINMYKGAILDGVDVDVKNLPASFGSVPELVTTFVNMLAAAWDIPATRFTGQSPGGLNATGQSDLENYYNMVQSFRERRLVPRIKQLMKILAIQEFGMEQGSRIADEMDIEFKPLWNLDTKSEAEASKAWLDGIMPLLDRGCISPRDFELEAKKRNIILLSDTRITDPDPDSGQGGNMFSDNLDKMIGGKKGEGDDSGSGQEQAPKQVQGAAEQRD
jgi:hypothetical protein